MGDELCSVIINVTTNHLVILLTVDKRVIGMPIAARSAIPNLLGLGINK